MKNVIQVSLAAAVLALPSMAEARRVAIDEGVERTFEGYCDSNGEECDKLYTLPYFVDFGSGETNKLRYRWDGKIEFVGAKLPGSDPIDQFDVLATVDAGNNSSTLPDQVAFGNEDPGDAFGITWITCKAGSCGEAEYGTDVKRVAGGFDIKITFVTGFSEGLIGWTTKTGSSLAPLTDASEYSFFLPAKFRAAIPEPSTWALMLAGFGLAGAALRKRGRLTAASASARRRT